MWLHRSCNFAPSHQPSSLDAHVNHDDYSAGNLEHEGCVSSDSNKPYKNLKNGRSLSSPELLHIESSHLSPTRDRTTRILSCHPTFRRRDRRSASRLQKTLFLTQRGGRESMAARRKPTEPPHSMCQVCCRGWPAHQPIQHHYFSCQRCCRFPYAQRFQQCQWHSSGRCFTVLERVCSSGRASAGSFSVRSDTT